MPWFIDFIVSSGMYSGRGHVMMDVMLWPIFLDGE